MKSKFLVRCLMMGWLAIIFAHGRASKCPIEKRTLMTQNKVENKVIPTAMHFAPLDVVKW